MRLGDIKVGQKFSLNDKLYLRIDVDPYILFPIATRNVEVICALDLSTYKVFCLSSTYEAFVDEE